jgi:hypothetical protein
MIYKLCKKQDTALPSSKAVGLEVNARYAGYDCFIIFCHLLANSIEFKIFKTIIRPVTLHGYETTVLTMQEVGCWREPEKIN